MKSFIYAADRDVVGTQEVRVRLPEDAFMEMRDEGECGQGRRARVCNEMLKWGRV
ncbi:hypothetical protein [Lujinxingia vulgaris]|uniref:hypothetical protein n=1 Tax=Lujinxingia vulgaris TaxID=2600176 RepID=UPI001E518F2A|nr:hypothetical protein [Lujinxingia vulgaris]